MQSESGKPETTEYQRGYQDGVAAASDKIAAFFNDQKKKHIAAVATMHQANAMIEGFMLNLLAPLQDEVRHLKLEIANGE